MIYPIEHYDKNGLLKLPKMWWLACLFSAKAWAIFVMAGVSRQQGADLLALFYPIHQTLYLGMGIGVPSLMYMWLSGHRTHSQVWVLWLWNQGRKALLIAYGFDLGLQLYHLQQTQGEFQWGIAIQLLLTIWFLWYLIKSQRVRAIFSGATEG